MFDCEIEVYHKGEYVGKCHEISSEHWVFLCDVKRIEVGEYMVGIYTN